MIKFKYPDLLRLSREEMARWEHLSGDIVCVQKEMLDFALKFILQALAGYLSFPLLKVAIRLTL